MEEEIIKNNNYKKEINIYTKSFDELINDSKFANSFNKLPNNKSAIKTSLQGKTIMEQEYGFIITNTPIRVMQVDNITSYTFHIKRNLEDNLYFENLVIQNDSIGNTTANIVKYTPSEPMTSFAEHNSYTFEGETEITSIIYNDNQISETGKIVTSCRDMYGFRCTGRSGTSGSCGASPHIPTGACTFWTPSCIAYTFITKSCTSYDDGTGDDGGGFNPGGTSSYGTGGGNNGPIYSDPVCGNNCIDEEIITPQDLCNDLASKDANPDFINYMADLKTRAASQGFESAYTMFQNASLGLQFSPRYDGSLQDPVVDIGVGFTDTSADLNSIGAIHCHLDNGTTFKIFSFEDIIALAKFADISTRPTPEFGIYVVTSSGTFCLKIKNKIQLKQMLVRMIGTQFTYENNFAKKVKTSDSLDKQILGFLKFLKENHFGNILELYKKNETNNTWQKQELNSNETTVNPTNC